MNAHTTRRIRYTAFLALLVPATGALGAGCRGADEPETDGEEAIGQSAAAATFTSAPPGDPRYDPTCTNTGSFGIHNPEWPYHASGPCPAVDAYTFGEAVAQCGGEVKYFGYSCTDFPSTDEHAWTVSLGCCAAKPGVCVPPPSGMTGWWPGDGNANSQLLGGPTGTLSGSATFGQAKVGQGFVFDGKSMVSFGTSPAVVGTGPFAVDAWVQTTVGGTVIAQRDPSGFDGEYRLEITPAGNVYWWSFGDGQIGFDFSSTATVNDGRFHLVVATREADGSGRIYIDGNLDSTGSAPPRTLAPFTVSIGNDARDGSPAFTGTIDEVEIFDRALTATEVTSLYQAGSAGKCKAGKIVLSQDEYVLSDQGISAAPSAATLATNVASWFTGGRAGKFLAYSFDFGLTGTKLANAMTSAGHTWTVSTTVPFTLATLQQYDGVFLAGTMVDQNVLSAYVASGGNVFLEGGTGYSNNVFNNNAAAEAAQWSSFLAAYGLELASGYNGVGAVLPVSSSHPILVGVSGILVRNGQDVGLLNPSDPHTSILLTGAGHPGLAIYQ